MKRKHDEVSPGAWPREVNLPGVREVRVQLKHFGYNPKPKSEFNITKTSWLEREDCDNPMCHNGGVAIGRELRAAIAERQTKIKGRSMCKGHEGNSRQRGRDCMHSFTWDGVIEYEEGEMADGPQ